MIPHPGATILWLRDREGLFPHVRFPGDTDVATAAWMSFTSTARNEVVIASMTADEWNAGAGGEKTVLERVGIALNRTDLRAIKLFRVGRVPHLSNQSLQEFRQTHNQPTMVYSSLSGVEEAFKEREQTIDEFRREGYVVTQVDV